MRINIARPEISDEEIEAVCAVLKSGMIASGPETLAFENEFAEFVGCEFACAVNNGTSALSLALAPRESGQEMKYYKSVNFRRNGKCNSQRITPVFADIESDTYIFLNLSRHNWKDEQYYRFIFMACLRK